MSEVTQVEEGQEFEQVDASSGALSDRMAVRADQLEKNQTEWFPIPGYEDVLEVELRALGYKTIRATIRRNEKIRDPDVQEVVSMADQIAKATVGFREVLPGGKTRQIDDDWVRLAKRLPNCPDDVDTRRAVLFLVTDKRIAFLVQDWAEWARSVRKDVDEEVAADFAVTG